MLRIRTSFASASLIVFLLGLVFYNIFEISQIPLRIEFLLNRLPATPHSLAGFSAHEDTVEPIASRRSKPEDVLVFVHVQKTGGSLIEKRLTNSHSLNRTCHLQTGFHRWSCKTPAGVTWLISRYSTGWICGVHADFTRYSDCLDDALMRLDKRNVSRKFAYFTILRNPVDRYISEWLHANRGGTWASAQLSCSNRLISSTLHQLCYIIPEYLPSNRTALRGKKHHVWYHRSLSEFITCPYNFAHNRQTRMLANLSTVGCYSGLLEWNQPLDIKDQALSTAQRLLLSSAIQNVVGLFRAFGLSEYMSYTQYLFQTSMGIVFDCLFQPNLTNPKTHAAVAMATLNNTAIDHVRRRNAVDMKLYDFARHIFLVRLVARVTRDSAIGSWLKRPLLTLQSSRNFRGLDYVLLRPQSPFREIINGVLRRKGSKICPRRRFGTK